MSAHLIMANCVDCGGRVAAVPDWPTPRCVECGRKRHGVGAWRYAPSQPWPGCPVRGDRPFPPPEPWPEPEVTARPATLTEIPSSAADIAAKAYRAGWSVEVTYARGTVPYNKTDRRVVDSVAVRMRYRALNAVGVWENRKFAGAWIWSIIELPKRASYGELVSRL